MSVRRRITASSRSFSEAGVGFGNTHDAGPLKSNLKDGTFDTERKTARENLREVRRLHPGWEIDRPSWPPSRRTKRSVRRQAILE
jgi:hypothetical protein